MKQISARSINFSYLSWTGEVVVSMRGDHLVALPQGAIDGFELCPAGSRLRHESV